MALANAVFVADHARREGITYRQAHAVVLELDTPAAQQAGEDVLWYVYVSNSDGRLSSRKLSNIVLRACTIREQKP